MINANWLFLIVSVSFGLGYFLHVAIDLLTRKKTLETIEEILSEHGDCDHDVEGPSADYDGHHFISYSIDKKGREKILEAL